MKAVLDRIKDSRGISRLAAILLAGVAAMCVLFIADGYIRHLQQAKLLFDQTQVANAIKLAKVQYMEDGEPDGITYYFDAERSEMVGWDQIGRINGYGRSSRAQNADAQTGAKGIPNTGGKNGGQFLAIAIENADDISARWQGHRLTAYDYTLMTPEERARLTTEQLGQIELDGSE
jgi:hypothetical protein